MTTRRRRADEGFTLIELLVVIVILGILASIVVFAVGGITDHGQSAACKAEKKTIQTAEEAYFANQKFDPTYTTTDGLVAAQDLDSTPTSYQVTTADSSGYTITPVANNANGCS